MVRSGAITAIMPVIHESSTATLAVQRSLSEENSYAQIYPQGTVPTVLFSDLAAPVENVSR